MDKPETIKQKKAALIEKAEMRISELEEKIDRKRDKMARLYERKTEYKNERNELKMALRDNDFYTMQFFIDPSDS